MNLMTIFAQKRLGFILVVSIIASLNVVFIGEVFADGCIPPPDGMVANWRAENNAVDSVSGAAGTLFNGVTYAPGKVGQGFSFNGQGSYISVANRAALNLSNAFTVEFWYKDNGTTPTGGGFVTKRILTGNQQVNYGTAIYPGGQYNITRLYINDPTVWYQYSQYSPTPPADVFHHFAALFQQADPSTVQLSTYIDGILVYSSTVSGNLAKTTNAGPLYIGASSPTQEFFNGVIDEISIYNRALTPTEIQAIFLAGSAGKCASPTAPYVYVPPGNTVARVGDNPTLTVAAGGTAPISYQWICNGTNLPGATNYSLTITNIQTSQAGTYQVLMSNTVGTNLTSPITLTVPIFDQGQFNAGWWQPLRQGTGQFELAQTFVPAISGRLVDIGVAGDGTQGFPTVATIVDTTNGQPGTNVLGRTQLGTLASDAQFLFTNNPIYLNAGTMYAAVFSTDAGLTGQATYEFRVSLGDDYSPGALWQLTLPSGQWQPDQYNPTTPLDLVFATYMQPGIPAIWLSAPLDGNQFQSSDIIPITASLSPTVTNPQGVAFYAGTNLIGNAAQSPYTFSWTNPPPGQQTLTAVLNTGNGSVTSAPISISVVANQPPNDRFTNRISLVGDYCLTAITNTHATLDAGEPRPNPFSIGQSVWWTWTPPRTAWVTLAVPDPAGTNIVLGVYTGVSVDALLMVTNGVRTCTFLASTNQTYQFVADSFNAPVAGTPLELALSDLELTAPLQNAVSTAPTVFNVQAARTSTNRTLASVDFFEGTNLVATVSNSPYAVTIPCPDPGYYSLWARAWDTLGVPTISQTVSNTVRPANDNFSQAVTVYGYRTNIQTFNSAATMEPGERIWASNVGGHSIWYRWTAPSTGLCTIGQTGPFGLLINVYVGNTVSQLSFINGNAFGDSTTTPLQFQALAGTNYCISLDGFYGDQGPIDWSLTLEPENDGFSNRVQILGSQYQSTASVSGSSLEPGEANLSANPNAGSIWWTWTANASAQTTISAVPSTAPVELMVFVGSDLTNLTLITNSDPAWSTNASVTFQAQQGTAYQIAVVGDGTQTSGFTLNLSSQSLHFISPEDLSVFQAPGSVQLAVEQDGAPSSPVEVDYYANNSLIGTVTNAPFTFAWNGVSAGTYALVANAVLPGGATNSSVPVTILVYTNEDVPSPHVFAGTFSSRSFVVNEVGSVYLLGFPPSAAATGTNKYIHNSPIDGFHPRLANWLVDRNTRWERINDGWALTTDGKLYQEGITNIPTPTGVSHWNNLGNNGWAFGDDGQIYSSGSNLVTFAATGIAWQDGGPGYDSTVTLAQDGRAFKQGTDIYGHPSSSLISLPAGVTRWKSVGIAAHFAVLMGDDGNLYQTTSDPPAAVPFPAGVTNWGAFAVGGFHVMALGSDGQLYVWGRNNEGELGQGFAGADLGPSVKVPLPPGVSAWTGIAAGYMHSLAIGSDGALYAWGANDNGQLGIGPLPSQDAPTRVDGVGALWAIPIISTSNVTLRQPDGSFLIRFKTDLNRVYLIQYSDDGRSWKTASPSVTGTGGYVDWIDDGPPKTETAPANTPMRTYRVSFSH